VSLEAIEGLKRILSDATQAYSPGTITLDPLPFPERFGKPKMNLLWPVVAFTDAQGVRWTRDNTGKLSEVDRRRSKVMSLLGR
jgi:hypothetical protein